MNVNKFRIKRSHYVMSNFMCSGWPTVQRWKRIWALTISQSQTYEISKKKNETWRRKHLLHTQFYNSRTLQRKFYHWIYSEWPKNKRIQCGCIRTIESDGIDFIFVSSLRSNPKTGIINKRNRKIVCTCSGHRLNRNNKNCVENVCFAQELKLYILIWQNRIQLQQTSRIPCR